MNDRKEPGAVGICYADWRSRGCGAVRWRTPFASRGVGDDMPSGPPWLAASCNLVAGLSADPYSTEVQQPCSSGCLSKRLSALRVLAEEARCRPPSSWRRIVGKI